MGNGPDAKWSWGWRLPNVDVNGDGIISQCGPQALCMDNEYGHLFSFGAGTIPGGGVTSASSFPFSSVQAGEYWSTPLSGPNNRWGHNFGSGLPFIDTKSAHNFAWAVRDGDVAPVPSPSAMLLMGTGLISLMGWRWWGTKHA